jgi:hypothetical protein
LRTELYQVKEAFTDPVIWGFVFYALVADIPNGGISNFFSQLIVSFGYSKTIVPYFDVLATTKP